MTIDDHNDHILGIYMWGTLVPDVNFGKNNRILGIYRLYLVSYVDFGKMTIY